jgi:GT2 family glycosyltransferase
MIVGKINKDLQVKKSFCVLITCHNRREKTLECLRTLYQNRVRDSYQMDVFLVDDGSTDKTSEFVAAAFPSVRIIKGDGTLFWNRGMLRAWKAASSKQAFDFYLWLNDDTFITEDGLENLFQCYEEALIINNRETLIVGICRNSFKGLSASYGVRKRRRKDVLEPNGEIQSGNFINGNCVLISRKIFEEVGYLDPAYSHSFGDIDYGLRVLEKEFAIGTTKSFICVCKSNDGLIPWQDPKISLFNRIRYLRSPRGHPLREVIYFRRRFWPKVWLFFVLVVIFKVLNPRFYNYLLRFKKVVREG